MARGGAGSDLVVGFRPMGRADIPVVMGWLREPHVARWWVVRREDEQRAAYEARIDGRAPTRMRVIEANGRSVGFVQDYRLADHSQSARLTGRPEAVGIDYAIGDPAWVGRGVATHALGEYVSRVLPADYPQAPEVLAAPDHRNTASLRVLEKLGFTQGLWFDEPQPDGTVATLIACTRPLGPPTSSV